MAWKNRVIWQEGLFLQPQHFQQQDRHMEAYVEGRCGALRHNGWGLIEIELDESLMNIGKFGLTRARGVFPDGTPFNIPVEDDLPAPIDLVEGVLDCPVYLALPARKLDAKEVQTDEEKGLARMLVREYEMRDVNSSSPEQVLMQVGSLSTRLLLNTEERGEYVCLPLAHIVECSADRVVTLRNQFLPPALDLHSLPGLPRFLTELKGLLHHRGQALAARVTSTGQGGTAEIADFLMLQLVNRYQPLVTHFCGLKGIHPEALFVELLTMAGELATFSQDSRQPPEFTEYRHGDLESCFVPLIAFIRESLSTVLEQNATALPLSAPKFGIRTAQIPDQELLSAANFVLAVKASVPPDEIRKRFPAQTKIGSVETIRDLVLSQLPGIPISSLAVAPRQIPYHSGFVYYELVKQSESWGMLKSSKAFAIHVGGEFPDIQMEFWAIRR